jgi:hypothetical protein
MIKELKPLYSISPTDAGLIALLRKSLSSLNQTAVMRRWHSPLERRLISKHALYHFDLFNSPTFDAKAWVNFKFFHGIKGTKWDHVYRQSCETMTTRKDIDGPVDLRPRFPALLDPSTMAFLFEAKRELPSAPQEVNFWDDVIALPGRVIGSVARSMESERKVFGDGVRSSTMRATQPSKVTDEVQSAQALSHTGLALNSAARSSMNTAEFNGKTWDKVNWKQYLQPNTETEETEMPHVEDR